MEVRLLGPTGSFADISLGTAFAFFDDTNVCIGMKIGSSGSDQTACAVLCGQQHKVQEPAVVAIERVQSKPLLLLPNLFLLPSQDPFAYTFTGLASKAGSLVLAGDRVMLFLTRSGSASPLLIDVRTGEWNPDDGPGRLIGCTEWSLALREEIGDQPIELYKFTTHRETTSVKPLKI